MGGGKFLRKKDPLLKSPSEGIQKFPTDSNHPPPPKIPPKKIPKGTKPPKMNKNNKAIICGGCFWGIEENFRTKPGIISSLNLQVQFSKFQTNG